MEILKKAQSGPLNVSHLMREFMSDDSMKKHAKELAKFAAKCADDISKMAKETRDVKSATGIIDEYVTLEESKKFFEKAEIKHQAVLVPTEQIIVEPPAKRISSVRPVPEECRISPYIGFNGFSQMGSNKSNAPPWL